MNTFLKFLYKYNILEIGEGNVNKWLKNKKLESLKYGMKEGTYDIRLSCLKAYISLNTNDLKKELLRMLNDSVPVVSQFAIFVLEQKFHDKKVQEIITQKRAYWKRYESKIKQVNYSRHNLSIEQRQSPSDKLQTRFDQQKRMNDIPIGY